MDGALNGAMIAVRAVHFTSTICLAGTLAFLAYVAEPSLPPPFPPPLAGEGKVGAIRDAGWVFRSTLDWMIWPALILALASGMGWLALVAQQMSELPFATILSEGTIGTVLFETGFGQVWLLRLLLWLLLALVLVRRYSAGDRRAGTGAPVVALALLGSLAWAGHAAATPGSLGFLHLFADSLHLLAAGTWVGALIPLALLLGSSGSTQASIPTQHELVRRFSILGIASVAALVASGFVNSWILIARLSDLVETGYGRLLSLKVALFLIMLALAAINRLVLSPDLSRDPSMAQLALRRIRRNTVIEAALGLLIILVVSVLGMLPPMPED
jgi:putative copper resistance protein D